MNWHPACEIIMHHLLISQTTLHLRHAQRPSPCIFSHLAAEAKPVCNNKVQELEECIEEYLQAASLNFGENAEELNKTQTDFLVSMLKLVSLRREYLKVMFEDEVVKVCCGGYVS